jgi:hypothetical protein
LDEVERALSQIADIHARVTASSRFRGFAPEAMAFNAALSLAVAVAQTIWPQVLAANPLRYVAVWGGAMAASTLVSATEAISRSRGLHGRMADAMLGATLRLLLPFAAAAIVIAAAICRFSPASAWMLPGLWQILVALAGFSAASTLPRPIVWAAGWYFVCGAVVLGLGARNGELTPWMMGLPFAVGQAGVAVILHRANGDLDGGK